MPPVTKQSVNERIVFSEVAVNVNITGLRALALFREEKDFPSDYSRPDFAPRMVRSELMVILPRPKRGVVSGCIPRRVNWHQGENISERGIVPSLWLATVRQSRELVRQLRCSANG